MGEDDDLRLNTLHRFEKGASRLTLREYSHCEVPAGCGGVVMRWIDPDDPPPVRVGVVVLGSAETWLDGEPLASSFTRMRGGRHVVAAHFTELGSSWRDSVAPPVPFAPVIHGDPGRDVYRAENLLAGVRDLRIRRAPSPPDPDFASLSYDDSGWPEAPVATEAALARLSAHDYHLTRLAEAGVPARLVGAGGATEAWVRISFTLSEATLRKAAEESE